MSAPAAVKYAAPAVLPFAAVTPIDLWWALFIPLGLVLGWLARAGRMLSENRSVPEIKRDMIISLLIGGGNALLTALIVWVAHLNYLQGVVAAFICAFAGLPTLDAAVRWLSRHVISDIRAGEKRQAAQLEESIEHLVGEHRIRSLAEEIDRRNERLEP